jgi:hypothetical protein
MPDIKMLSAQPGIDPGFTPLQHSALFLPLDHLAYTCFNSFFILLHSFSSRVELKTTMPDIKTLSAQPGIDPGFTPLQNFVFTI